MMWKDMAGFWTYTWLKLTSPLLETDFSSCLSGSPEGLWVSTTLHPTLWPIGKSMTDYCILWLPGEFCQRGTPTSDGRRKYLFFWFLPNSCFTLAVSFQTRSFHLSRQFAYRALSPSWFWSSFRPQIPFGPWGAPVTSASQASYTITCGSLQPHLLLFG